MKILCRWWENEKCWRSARRSQEGKNELQWKKKSEQEHKQKKIFVSAYDIFSPIKCVTRKFHVVAVQSNGKEMYKFCR